MIIILLRLLSPNAFAPVGRTPTLSLTQGDALGYGLLDLQPVICFWDLCSL